MKYKITPFDVTNYFVLADLPVSRQNHVLQDLFSQHNQDISLPYRNDFHLFRNTVSSLLNSLDISEQVLSEADLFLQEVSNGSIYRFQDKVDEYDIFGVYFKYVKLQIMYSPQQYKKLKLRTILHEFGYQRRSTLLVETLNRTLRALKLETYLRGNEVCKISDISIDDMIILRLKK